jgi:hypothetical protein
MRQQISRQDICRASPISPTDKWLWLRDLIIVMCQGFAPKVVGHKLQRDHIVLAMKKTSSNS